MRMLETGGCGAVIGAIAFTIIAGFITNAEQVPLMTYSPLIGGVCGGAVSFLIALAADFRKIKEFQEKMAHLEKNQKIGFLRKNINSSICPLQLRAIAELKKMNTPEAYEVLREASRREISPVRNEILKALKEKVQR